MNLAYSDDELEIMLADIESDLVERKESLAGDARKTIRQAVCAMANDLPGHGQPRVVFVGATDKGTPTGLEITDELLRFDDRIEITNPGGPYGGVTTDNFGRPGIVSYRNPNLAEAMRALGLVQRYGVGIPLARRKLIENGQSEPVFDVDAHWVNCTVRVRP